MVTITIEDNQAVFSVEGMHRLWAIKSRLEVPLEHIADVRVDPKPAMRLFDGFKVIGTDVPQIFRAGTFYLHGNLVFYDVRHTENTIVVELHDERYAELIIEVSDPEAAVRMLKSHLSQNKPASGI